jgi:hypothetical protein
VAVLGRLVAEGTIKPAVLEKAVKALNVDPDQGIALHR